MGFVEFRGLEGVMNMMHSLDAGSVAVFSRDAVRSVGVVRVLARLGFIGLVLNMGWFT